MIFKHVVLKGGIYEKFDLSKPLQPMMVVHEGPKK